VDQNAIDQVFLGMPHLQAAQMQSPYLLHSLVEMMKIEKLRRNEALAVMMKLNKASNESVVASLGGADGIDCASVDSIISGNITDDKNFLARAMTPEEEDRVRVMTVRSASTNALVCCCIAKVRNSHWENLLQAVPKQTYRVNSVDEMLAKPAAKRTAARATVF